MRQIEIFDTTLRDGEQAPGAALTAAAKLEVARALADLGVDTIEAGFPAASDGEAAAVRQIAQDVTGVTMAALAIAWLLHLPEITAVVVGPSRLQHLAPVSEALGVTLDDDERDALERIFR